MTLPPFPFDVTATIPGSAPVVVGSVSVALPAVPANSGWGAGWGVPPATAGGAGGWGGTINWGTTSWVTPSPVWGDPRVYAAPAHSQRFFHRFLHRTFHARRPFKTLFQLYRWKKTKPSPVHYVHIAWCIGECEGGCNPSVNSARALRARARAAR